MQFRSNFGSGFHNLDQGRIRIMNGPHEVQFRVITGPHSQWRIPSPLRNLWRRQTAAQREAALAVAAAAEAAVAIAGYLEAAALERQAVVRQAQAQAILVAHRRVYDAAADAYDQAEESDDRHALLNLVDPNARAAYSIRLGQAMTTNRLLGAALVTAADDTAFASWRVGRAAANLPDALTVQDLEDLIQ